MEKMEVVTEPIDDFNKGLSRAIRIGGATASITIINLILYFFKIIPEKNVCLAIGFFVSLPLLYSFIFGIIVNKPNFSGVFRHYSFAAYIIVALVIFQIILKPTSILEFIRYLFHFILGLVFAVIGYFFYSAGYRLSMKLKVWKYRWRTLISFGVSLVTTFLIALILRKFNVFGLI